MSLGRIAVGMALAACMAVMIPEASAEETSRGQTTLWVSRSPYVAFDPDSRASVSSQLRRDVRFAPARESGLARTGDATRKGCVLALVLAGEVLVLAGAWLHVDEPPSTEGSKDTGTGAGTVYLMRGVRGLRR